MAFLVSFSLGGSSVVVTESLMSVTLNSEANVQRSTPNAQRQTQSCGSSHQTSNLLHQTWINVYHTVRKMRAVEEQMHRETCRWPAHGWVGLVLLAVCWPLNWTLPGVRTAYLFF